MYVFSIVPHPVSVPYYTDKDQKLTEYVTIRPGRNDVDDQVLTQIRDRLTSKFDAGFMRFGGEDQDLSKKEKLEILGEPSRAYIETLCAKAAPIDSGKTADGEYEIVGR